MAGKYTNNPKETQGKSENPECGLKMKIIIPMFSSWLLPFNPWSSQMSDTMLSQTYLKFLQEIQELLLLDKICFLWILWFIFL